MRVAFVSQPWDTLQPPVSAGSIPIWTYETAKRLVAAQDCWVTLYARQSEGQLAHEAVEGIEYRRVSVAGNRLCNAGCKVAAKVIPKFRYLSSRLYALPYFVRVAMDVRQQGYDIVHVHNFSQAVPILRSLNPKTKVVLHMHCEWLTQFDRKLIAHRLEQCDLVVGCSSYIAEKVRSLFPQCAERTQRVYNGVDIRQFSATKPHSELKSAPQPERIQYEPAHAETSYQNSSADTVLFVGRISPEKGLHTLLNAFERVVEQCPDAHLQIVGPNKPASAELIAELSDDPKVQRLVQLDPPNYLQHLKAQITADLAAHVTFVGQVSHLQLQDYYHRAALLVNPSLSEAFGMSLVEAMAAGIPVVATRVGGMMDVVCEGETGLLVPADDPDALAAAIVKLLQAKALRREMGEKGRSRAEKVFAWEAIAADLITHYRTLLGSKV